MEFILLYSIGVILAFLLGLLIARMLQPKTIGSLVVDHSDLDGPHLFLEIEDHDWYKELANHNTVTFKVVFKDYLSQE